MVEKVMWRTWNRVYFDKQVGTFVEKTFVSMMEEESRKPVFTTTTVRRNDMGHETITLKDARLSIRALQLDVFKRGAFNIDKIGGVMKQKIAFEASYSAMASGRKTGGVDGIKPSYYREDVRRLSALGNEVYAWLLDRTQSHYAPCRMCPIPKKDGSIRMLSVPNISDNAKLNCLLTLISPLAERFFQAVWELTDNRFLVSGSRTGLGVENAVGCLKLLHRRIGRGYKAHIIFCDIASCFPSIPHTLVRRVLSHINCPPWVIKELVKASQVFMIGNPQRVGDNMGLPQGNPASPLICNLVVTYLLMGFVDQSKVGMISYLDDLAIVCPEGVLPEQVLSRISRCLDRNKGMKVGMALKPSKTEIITGQKHGCARWLGMDVWLRPSTKWKSKATSIRFALPPYSLAKVMQKCNQVLVRTKGKADPVYLVNLMQPIVLGSCNYNAIFVDCFVFRRILLKRLVWRLTVYYLKSKRHNYSTYALCDLLLLRIFNKLTRKPTGKQFNSFLGTLDLL